MNSGSFRLASDPDAVVEKLSDLASSEDELVRGAVTLNSITTLNVIIRLFVDESSHVQECLR
jgi:hypothetical protein